MDAVVAVDICRALADNNRLRLVQMLAKGELCACKLLEAFAISQPTLSHHMRILCDVGLVNCRRDGRWCHYSLNHKLFSEFSVYWQQLTMQAQACGVNTSQNPKLQNVAQKGCCQKELTVDQVTNASCED